MLSPCPRTAHTSLRELLADPCPGLHCLVVLCPVHGPCPPSAPAMPPGLPPGPPSLTRDLWSAVSTPRCPTLRPNSPQANGPMSSIHHLPSHPGPLPFLIQVGTPICCSGKNTGASSSLPSPPPPVSTYIWSIQSDSLPLL